MARRVRDYATTAYMDKSYEEKHGKKNRDCF